MQGVPSDKVLRYLIPFDKATFSVSLFPTCEKNLPPLHKSAQHFLSASIFSCKMDTTGTESKDANDGQQRPELSPEDRMVSSYLEDRSEIYRDLVKVQDDVNDFRFP